MSLTPQQLVDGPISELANGAFAAYRAELERASEDTKRLEDTGRWVGHGGFDGEDGAFLFEVVQGGETSWINQDGEWVAYSLSEYWDRL